jgi:hypothetical protein
MGNMKRDLLPHGGCFSATTLNIFILLILSNQHTSQTLDYVILGKQLTYCTSEWTIPVSGPPPHQNHPSSVLELLLLYNQRSK